MVYSRNPYGSHNLVLCEPRLDGYYAIEAGNCGVVDALLAADRRLYRRAVKFLAGKRSGSDRA